MHEFLIAIILLILLALVANPFGLWMPDSLSMMLLIGVVAVFVLFASLVWRERPRDERESYHAALSGRLAFLAGSCMLLLAVVVQSYQHALDPWLIGALAGMILVKVGAQIYSRRKL